MLLYVEDNKEIWSNVVAYLEAEWFTVDWYKDWESWIEAGLTKRYDCIILDVMLPWVNGMDICKAIREKKRVPIIMTTAKGTIHDKSQWFWYGADDYLVKPFEMAELVMRINALLKRSDTHDHIVLWDVEIYVDENRVVKAWEEISLTLKERQIFIALVDAWWSTVERSSLIEIVWWWDALFDNNDWKLDVYIANLRRKLWRELIETIKGVWYRIV